jgi:SAM-dependent methyltransferase
VEAVAELLADSRQGHRVALEYAVDLRRRRLAQGTAVRRLSALRALVRLANEVGLLDWMLELPDDLQVAQGLEELAPDVAYVLPRHPMEVERLDIQHYALQEARGRNYLAPARWLSRVLDVGCGTGQWAFDLCAEFPEALVVGLDLKPGKAGAPANYCFVRSNLLQGLPFVDDSFDFVHQRLLFSGVPVEAWPTTVRELVRVCRPGGWIELVEGASRSERVGPATQRLTELLLQLNRTTGLDLDSVVFNSLERYLREAGVKEVARETVELPIGEWAGRLGSLMASDLRALFTRMSAVFTARLGIPAEECVELVRAAQLEWEEHHTIHRLAVAYGRKPAGVEGGRLR